MDITKAFDTVFDDILSLCEPQALNVPEYLVEISYCDVQPAPNSSSPGTLANDFTMPIDPYTSHQKILGISATSPSATNLPPDSAGHDQPAPG